MDYGAAIEVADVLCTVDSCDPLMKRVHRHGDESVLLESCR